MATLDKSSRRVEDEGNLVAEEEGGRECVGSPGCETSIGMAISASGAVSQTGRCAFGDDSGDVLIVIRKVQLTKSNSVLSPFSLASSSSNCWATIDKSSRRFVKRGVEDEERGEALSR